MKNQRKYIDVPTIEEIKQQYNEVLELIKDITTFEQVKELMKNYSRVLNVEINYNSISDYKGEEIKTIRYEYKNILFYFGIADGKAELSSPIIMYDNEGQEFGELSLDSFDKYKIVLHHVELEEGLNKTQIINLLDKLEEDDNGYIPIELHANNSSAYGFITSSYYEELSFDKSSIAKVIEPVLEDWNKEREDKKYKLEDGIFVYMECDQETI